YAHAGAKGEQWTRPGKDAKEGHSATMFPNGNLFVFSPNAHPFRENTCYDPFAQYAYLEHNGDFTAAATDLGAHGFGEIRSEPSGFGNFALFAGTKTSAEPQPDDDKVSWPAPLSAAAFIGLAGEFVRAVEPHTEADPAAILIQFLVGFGNVIGRSAHFKAEADLHYLNEFAVIVGATSKGRKGTSAGQVRARLRESDADWDSKAVVEGLSSGEGLIWAVRDPIWKKEAIKEKGRTVDYQEVIADDGVSDKRLFVTETEFANVLKVAAREGNTLSPVIRRSWDTGDLRSLTKNSPARATGAHISIIGHITGDELRRCLDATELANGFANRFLWFVVRRSKLLPEGGRLIEAEFHGFNSSLQHAVQFARSVEEIKRDDEARELWFEVYPKLSEGKPGLLGAITTRAEAHVMRLACIYALFDRSKVIRKEHLKAALEVWRYCEDSVRHIFGKAVGDPLADQIIGILRESGEDGLTRLEISNALQRHHKGAVIARALN